MKISTKGRYAVVAMYDLAMNFQTMPVSLKSIATRQGISEAYLEKLMSYLKKANLVESTRGAQGGYVLAKSPSEITVGDIIRVMQGPIAPVDCLLSIQPFDDQYCEKSDSCITKNVWQKVGQSIENVLDSITLADLCNQTNDKKSFD